MRDPAYIGLGANLGDARATLALATARLAALPGVGASRASSLFSSSPQGAVRDQPWFVNGVVALDFAVAPSPSELLAALLALEAEAGRDRRRDLPGGPRALDLDLLAWGARRQRDATLTLPHPRLATRAFVLAPLVELAGRDHVIPGVGAIGPLLDAVAAQPVERIV